MKANELRIGNWVLLKRVDLNTGGESFEQVYITGNDIKEAEQNRSFYPITLTPEILEKAGFEKYEWMDGYFKKTKFGDLMVQFCKGGIYTYFTNIGSDGQGMKMRGRKWVGNLNSTQNIIHLHQLQNLYFALTGEELSITL